MHYETLTLGSLLRLLLERLDRDVEAAYRAAGVVFKPRYAAVYRLLACRGEMRIGEIVAALDLSQPSVTNTLAAMSKDGLVVVRRGSDRRERLVTLSEQAVQAGAELERQWRRTARAAASLDADVGVPLEEMLRAALMQLDRESFLDRMASASGAEAAGGTRGRRSAHRGNSGPGQ